MLMELHRTLDFFCHASRMPMQDFGTADWLLAILLIYNPADHTLRHSADQGAPSLGQLVLDCL